MSNTMTASAYLQQIEPLYVLGPTARNGVTLLQRLLNSSGQIMVSGENTALTEMIPGHVHALCDAHAKVGDTAQQARERFAAEDHAFWSSSLMPDTAVMAQMAFDYFARLARLYEQTAKDHGRDRWGIKTPIASPTVWQRLMALTPKAQTLFIYRDPLDVAASAKARRFLQAPNDWVRLAQQWSGNVAAVLGAKASHTLAIRYEALVGNPDLELNKIQTFTGIDTMDPVVMETKVNTFAGSAEQGHSETQYIPPAPLTDQEIAGIEEQTASARAMAGYADGRR